MPFELIAAYPALDFVNTLDWRFRDEPPEELLKTYEDLLRFTEQSGVITAKQARSLRSLTSESTGARVLGQCTKLREALAEILYAQLDSRKVSSLSREAVESYFKAARQKQKLSWEHPPRAEWGWPANEPEPELPLWALSMSALELLTSEDALRIRDCGNPECRWLFLDTSKNHTRRWCDMKLCGNRMKARRFKAQHKA